MKISLHHTLLCLVIISGFLASCSVSRVSSERKFPAKQLKEDFSIFQGALEESHPSLYWFTPKEKMDAAFSEVYSHLNDSMTERQFRTHLLKVITSIRCGHTSINYSKRFSRYLDTAGLKLFPLGFKVWKDTLAVTANLNRKDSIFRRGTVVKSINNYSSKQLIDTFFNYITGDGYSQAGRYQTLSTFGTFGVLYKNVLGLTDSFAITYVTPEGSDAVATIPVYKPVKDSVEVSDSLKPEKYSQRDRRTLRRFSTRHVQVDTSLNSAYMLLNTFSTGTNLRKFFRTSFKNIDRLGLKHLVIDVRSNGGGEAGNSTLLTQYLTDHKFKVGDSLYAVKRSSKYRDYIKFQPIYWLITSVITHKRSDGNFHFGYYERHTFRPFKKHHFDGSIYILTGGNSFSATTLFAQELKGQKNVTIVGEETGGGAYGNTAWIIPELTLPNTRLRVGIPKFRFVMRRELVKEGRGVMPDVFAAPTAKDIQKGIDVKLEAVKALIIKANEANQAVMMK
ncbi:MAG: peptidase S41 [Chitinophagaceae bacterium]|nr:MAG: peptidase S41 [Chitinophagaceae bacterium]